MVFWKRISSEQRVKACFLKENTRFSLREIAKICHVSKSSVARICHLSTTRISLRTNISSGKVGRPRKITERDGRALCRALERLRARGANITVKNVVKESGISLQAAHRRTFSRFLNEKGYGYFVARRKGLVSEKDRKLRLKYARKMKRELARNSEFFKDEVAFYLDGVSFVHKQNPLQATIGTKSKVWRKKGEGLKFTAKGSKDLAGGRRLHLIVAIAYGKGVVLKEAYEKMNGRFFAQFIREHFNIAFARSGPKRNGKRLFIMDNDPSQRRKVVERALEDIEAELHEIPARSPDVNVIESIFHLLRMDLEDEAICENITSESFEQFRDRVFRSLERLPVEIVDRTIESMNNRIDAIIYSKGYRTKY